MQCVQSYQAGWKINENDEACYIEIDEDDDEGCVVDENEPTSKWSDLPDLLLEEIFAYLNLRERYYASMTCHNWRRAFYLKRVWSSFLVGDETLCRRKFNYYSGYQHDLDHQRTQDCLTRVGRYIKGFEFVPNYNFHNMHQFMTLLTFNIQQSRRPDCESIYNGVGKQITSFKYIFPCNMAMRETDDVKLFGTGGQLLKTLKGLLFELNKLKTLKLMDLNLERYEAKHLLDEVLESCNMVLRELCLINITNTHCPIMHSGLFFNLKVLIISPQNLDDDVLQLLSSTSLQDLHIFQNKYSPSTPAACSTKAWKLLRKDNPKIKVHLRIESSTNGDITFQPDAPVYSVTYRAAKNRITPEKIIQIVDMYKYTLTTYGHELLPKYICPKSFDNRIDSLLVLMARQCHNLTSLTIREKVSTSTLLLLAKAAINLRFFNVRRNAIIQKCEWPRSPAWTDDFYEWLTVTSRSYDSTEKEISQILGYKWTMLSDKSFKQIRIHLSGFSI